ncbi:MAG: O-antigen ligase domain-containing protein [Rhodospirillales bacterium]|nr:MAG: O-antigen ligase domain-containing protein [Rhodospirillales bacterium]
MTDRHGREAISRATAALGSRVTGAERAIAILIGAAVPSLVAGPLAIAFSFGLGGGLAMVTTPVRTWWADVRRVVTAVPGVLLLLAIVAWLPSIAFSVDTQRSVDAWSSTVAVVAAGVVVWAILLHRPHLHERLAKALVVAALIAVGIALAALFIAPEIIALVRLQGWMERDAGLALRKFANAAALMVPALLWAGFRLGRQWMATAIIAVGATVVMILATGARAPVAGLAGVLVFLSAAMALRLRRRAITAAMVAAILVAAGGVSWYLLAHERTFPEAQFEPYVPVWMMDLHRQAIWDFTVRQVPDAPLFGHGINAINLIEGADAEIPGLGGVLPSHPHNWVLQAVGETGVVGAVPLYLFVALLITGLATRFMRTGDPAVLAAGCVTAGYWASGLLNFSMWATWWQAAHISLLALLLAVAAADARASRR